jgi:hypothetical protein
MMIATAGVFALAIACSESKSPSPVSPTAPPTATDGGDAAADGSTLKVTAPGPVSPANGSTLGEFELVLRITASTAKFVTGSVPLAYRFELLRGGQVVDSFRAPVLEWRPSATLESNTEYGWRARAEQGTSFGPWSATWTFRTPDQPNGYIAGSEVYDPLYNGKTVGTLIGPTEWVPGVGIKLLDHHSSVEYQLATLTEGEISLLVTNTPSQTSGVKTKIMSMRDGRGDITTNHRRFTIEKRGGHVPGEIGWRIITSVEEVSAVGAERVRRTFHRDQTYLWTASWRGGRFQLTIREGGAGGPVIYSFGKGYAGTYNPDPHLAYIGAPVGRGGPGDATVPGMVARQLWISSRPRPAFANK